MIAPDQNPRTGTKAENTELAYVATLTEFAQRLAEVQQYHEEAGEANLNHLSDLQASFTLLEQTLELLFATPTSVDNSGTLVRRSTSITGTSSPPALCEMCPPRMVNVIMAGPHSDTIGEWHVQLSGRQATSDLFNLHGYRLSMKYVYGPAYAQCRLALTLQPGPYDDALVWPFMHDVIIQCSDVTLSRWVELCRVIPRRLRTRPRMTCFERVQKGAPSEWFGDVTLVIKTESPELQTLQCGDNSVSISKDHCAFRLLAGK